MEYQITYVPTQAFHRGVTMRQWWRANSIGYLYLIGVPLLALIFCLISGDFSFGGAGGAVLGGLLGIVLILVFMMLSSYRQTHQAVAKAMQAWKGRTIDFTFDENGFSILSDQSLSHCSWKTIQKVQRTPEALLLHATRPIALPIELLDTDLQLFIINNVVAAGGKFVR